MFEDCAKFWSNGPKFLGRDTGAYMVCEYVIPNVDVTGKNMLTLSIFDKGGLYTVLFLNTTFTYD